MSSGQLGTWQGSLQNTTLAPCCAVAPHAVVCARVAVWSIHSRDVDDGAAKLAALRRSAGTGRQVCQSPGGPLCRPGFGCPLHVSPKCAAESTRATINLLAACRTHHGQALEQAQDRQQNWSGDAGCVGSQAARTGGTRVKCGPQRACTCMPYAEDASTPETRLPFSAAQQNKIALPPTTHL